MTSLDVLRTIVKKEDFFKSKTCEDADWRFGSYLLLEYLISRGERDPRGVPFISKVSRGGKLLPYTLRLESSLDEPLTVASVKKQYYVPTYLAIDTYPGLIIDSHGTSLRRPLLATPRGDQGSVQKLMLEFEQQLGIDTHKSDWFVRGIIMLLTKLVDADIDESGIEQTMWAGDQMIES